MLKLIFSYLKLKSNELHLTPTVLLCAYATCNLQSLIVLSYGNLMIFTGKFVRKLIFNIQNININVQNIIVQNITKLRIVFNHNRLKYLRMKLCEGI